MLVLFRWVSWLALWGLIGWQQQHWSLFFPVLVFSPFILDATFTLVKRVLRREPFWRPHRTHNYQLLIQQGLSHRRTAYIYYGLMLLSAGLAVSLEQNFGQNPHIMVALLGLFIWFFCSNSLSVVSNTEGPFLKLWSKSDWEIIDRY